MKEVVCLIFNYFSDFSSMDVFQKSLVFLVFKSSVSSFGFDFLSKLCMKAILDRSLRGGVCEICEVWMLIFLSLE